MKKLFKINSILIMSLCMITFAVSAKNTDPKTPKPSKDNILIVKGDIFNDATVSIIAFYYDNDNCSWHKYTETSGKNRYSIILDPTLDYQIWYQDSDFHKKIVYIEKGSEGIWQCKVHLNFEIKTELFAHVYQSTITGDFYNKYYTVEGIGFKESERVASCMENPCIDEILSSQE